MKQLFITMLAITPIVGVAKEQPIVIDLSGLGGLEVKGGVDALYWRTFDEGTTYGFYSTQAAGNNLSSEPIELQAGYDWGFRLVAGVCGECQPVSVELEWIHFRETTSAKATPNPAFEDLRTLSVFNSMSNKVATAIKIKQIDRYNRVTLRGYRTIFQGCLGEIRGYLGGGWRDIFVHNHIQPEGSVVLFEDRVIKAALGSLSLGFSATSALGCGVGVGIRFGGFAGFGDLTYRAKGAQTSSPAVAQVKYSPPHAHCLAGIETDCAITYAYKTECSTIEGRIGYRLDFYLGIERIPPSLTVDLAPSATYRAYGGPYLGITVCY